MNAIYLDVRKAFDCFLAQQLANKVMVVEMCGFSFIPTFITDSTTCINCLEVLPVLSRVSPGSILCPFLFILHINDFPSLLK